MLRSTRRHPYAAWAILCLIVSIALAVWAYAATSASFFIEPKLSAELFARAEHNRAETAVAAAAGSFFLGLPLLVLGLVVIWTARRWR